MESRRSFLRTTAAAAVVSQTVRGANDRIQMGIIGTGERGMQDFRAFSYHEDCVFLAACDVNKLKLEPAVQMMGGKVDVYGDYRRILDRTPGTARPRGRPEARPPMGSLHDLGAPARPANVSGLERV